MVGRNCQGVYQKNLSFILSPQVNWPAAILFYLLYIAGILIFAVVPALAKNSWQHAMLYGAMFGFFTYMTYELTNLALLKDWPLNIVVVDIIWGVVLCTAVASIGYLIGRWLL